MNKNILWKNYVINIENSLLNNSVIEKAIIKFWDNNVTNLNDDKHIIALFRIGYTNGIYNTLGQLKKLNKEDKNYYINYIIDILSIKSNEYKEQEINKIIVSYGVRNGKAAIKKNVKNFNTKIVYQKYNHYNLPVSLNPLKYGSLIHFNKSQNMYLVQIRPSIFAKITKLNNINKVDIFKLDNKILSYVDKMKEGNSFVRIIGSNHYIYILQNGQYKLDLFKSIKPVRFIKPNKEDKKCNEKIITLDIETYDKVDDHGITIKHVYNLSWFDGHKTMSYYISDYNNQEELIYKAISDLTKRKYHSHMIYIHNFSNFDGVFLLKELTKHGIVDPIIHKGRIVTVSLTYSNKTDSRCYTIHFRDSYQILMSSLSKLAINFKVQTLKGIFPHRFVNYSNLNYIGPVPSIEYFDNISKVEYDKYLKSYINVWNLKNECQKYCIQDCVSLFQIITLFNKLIFEKFSLNINHHPTLSSLSFGIFLTKYLNKLKLSIPMLYGQTAKNIRLSYTGGSTDMFIPFNSNLELVYGYDINSLYPAVMQNKNFPIGKPTYFEGDIRKYDAEAFGFFQCKVEAPTDLIHPIIQLHVKTKAGTRTMSPTGTFECMLFSEEMDNAIKLGYKIKILWGYTFKKGKIFKSFVSDMYNIRLQYSKDHPMNYIAKILLNSLYGRLGMDDNFSYSTIISKESYLKYEEQNYEKIKDVMDLGDNYLVEIEGDETSSMLDDRNESHNINISISSAVTGYARILMTQFKNNSKMKLYYTDTDSIYTDLNPDKLNELINNIVDSKILGKLKIETISSRAIFISPKVYYLKTLEGEEIYKVKGLNKNTLLTHIDFETLINKNSKIIKTQDKWYKDISKGHIEVKNHFYTLQQTENKRELVYNTSNQLVGTKPYKLINNEISTLSNNIRE